MATACSTMLRAWTHRSEDNDDDEIEAASPTKPAPMELDSEVESLQDRLGMFPFYFS